MLKKIAIILMTALLFVVLCFLYFLWESKDTNLDGLPPQNLSKKYELYSKDVNWRNITVNKKEEFVEDSEKNSKNYEEGIGYIMCQQVKSYFVSEKKGVIGVCNNTGYLCIDLKQDKIVTQTKNFSEFKIYVQKNYKINKIKWIKAREKFDLS